jgi:hypothetical protein
MDVKKGVYEHGAILFFGIQWYTNLKIVFNNVKTILE